MVSVPLPMLHLPFGTSSLPHYVKQHVWIFSRETWSRICFTSFSSNMFWTFFFFCWYAPCLVSGDVGTLSHCYYYSCWMLTLFFNQQDIMAWVCSWHLGVPIPEGTKWCSVWLLHPGLCPSTSCTLLHRGETLQNILEWVEVFNVFINTWDRKSLLIGWEEILLSCGHVWYKHSEEYGVQAMHALILQIMH